MNEVKNQVITVTIPVTVNAEDMWSNVFGSGWEYSSVPITVKYGAGCDWEHMGTALVTIGEDEEDRQTRNLTVMDLAEAYGKLIAMGYHHCGAPLSLDDMDACASFDILQVAVFGELVYG
jgi:uncharacterized protein YwlG (UPF0340 family)